MSSERSVTFTLYRTAQDNAGSPVSLPWGEWCARYFSEHAVRGAPADITADAATHNKNKNGPAIVLGVVDGLRAKENVTEVHGVALDLDNLPEARVREVLAQISAFEFVVWSTHKHGAQVARGCPRLRVLFPFATPISPADHARAWHGLNQLVGGANDPATKDISRLHFLPSTFDASLAETYHNKGKWLTLEALPLVEVETARPAVGNHAALLARHGWALYGESGDNENWTRPGKDSGTSATWHRVKGVFFCFTSSAPPLEAQKGYSLSALRMALEPPSAALEGLTSDAPDVAAKLKEFGVRCDGLETLDRAVVRDEAVRLLKAAKFQSPGKLIDAAMARTSAPATDETSRLFDEAEPADQPVDGAELLHTLVRTLKRFVVLPDGTAEAMALWALYSHAYESFCVAPYLTIVSPVKRCGKTTLLRLLGRLVRRGVLASSLSPAVLFRLVDAHHPTLMLDEVDAWMQDAEELRGLLNDGHDRGAAAWRCGKGPGGEITLERYDAFGPKALAAIGKVPSTIEDRSIIVSMRRRGRGEPVEKFRRKKREALAGLQGQAARWALDHADELREAEPVVPDLGSDRAEDNWEPLLAVADLAGGDWSELARTSARALMGLAAPEDEEAGVQLLGDIRGLFDEWKAERIVTVRLLAALRELDSRPWSEWGRSGRPITPHALGRLLKTFGVVPDKWREGVKICRGYKAESFADAWVRYLPPTPPSEAPQPPQPENHGGNGHSQSATDTPAVAIAKNRKTQQSPECGVCGDSEPPLAAAGVVVRGEA